MYSYRVSDSFSYKKNFGLGAADFTGLLYTYPSYLGVEILTVSKNDMPDSMLGFTDGKKIVIKDGIKNVEDFVLFHEEEHVKDMSASELEVDRRALKRLIAKKTEKKIDAVLELLEKRWKIKIPSPEEFLKD